MNKYLNTLLLIILGTFWVALPQNPSNVTVDFGQNEGRPLVKDKFGGYTPEKVLWVSSIYDTNKTLGPLQLKIHRFQLWVNDVTAAQPRWVDTQNSQEYIIRQTQNLGITNFVTINTPPAVKNSDPKMTTFFTTVAENLVKFAAGRTIYLELFGEPDLSAWDWYTGYTTFEKFWHEFKIGYEAIALVRQAHPNLKIGGCGFAFAHTGGADRAGWYARFISRCKSQNVQLDFISYHQYLLWNDKDWLKTTDQLAVLNAVNIAKAQADDYRAAEAGQGRQVEFIISEFSWPHGDWNIAFNTARSFVNYRNCARTLESLMYLGLEQLDQVDKIFWAQSVGQWIEGWGESYDFWTFFPFVNWHFFKSGATHYTYNAAYYAFWLYGKMPETRKKILFNTDDLRGFAAADEDKNCIVVWNRTSLNQTFWLTFQGLAAPLTAFYGKSYLIDSRSYQNRQQYPTGTTIRLDSLESVTLESEATLFLEISAKPTGISGLDKKMADFRLEQNYPNPFNPVTTITYWLPTPELVTLTIFNSNGQMLETLVHTPQTAGRHSVKWTASQLTTGVYYYKLTAGDYTLTRKCLLVK